MQLLLVNVSSESEGNEDEIDATFFHYHGSKAGEHMRTPTTLTMTQPCLSSMLVLPLVNN